SFGNPERALSGPRHAAAAESSCNANERSPGIAERPIALLILSAVMPLGLPRNNLGRISNRALCRSKRPWSGSTIPQAGLSFPQRKSPIPQEMLSFPRGESRIPQEQIQLSPRQIEYVLGTDGPFPGTNGVGPGPQRSGPRPSGPRGGLSGSGWGSCLMEEVGDREAPDPRTVGSLGSGDRKSTR